MMKHQKWRPTLFHIEKWNQILFITPTDQPKKSNNENFIQLSFYQDKTYSLHNMIKIRIGEHYKTGALV